MNQRERCRRFIHGGKVKQGQRRCFWTARFLSRIGSVRLMNRMSTKKLCAVQLRKVQLLLATRVQVNSYRSCRDAECLGIKLSRDV